MDNKLSFRITSSKWLEAFKSNQTFALNQMVRGDQQFHVNSQELLVDLYDRWFAWLLSVEKQLSVAGQVGLPERDIMIRDTVALYAEAQAAWDQNAALDSKLRMLWSRSYKPAHEAYVAFLRKFEPTGAPEGFGTLCERLLGLMQHCLFALHEIDSMLYKPTERAFISVDDYGCTVYNQQGRDLLSERLRLYRRECALEHDGNEPLEVKQYADEAYSSSLLSHLEDTIQLGRTRC